MTSSQWICQKMGPKSVQNGPMLGSRYSKYWFRKDGWISKFKQARQKSKESKFEKMRAKLEQQGITILGAPMKEKPENQGEMIYKKLSQPPFNC